MMTELTSRPGGAGPRAEALRFDNGIGEVALFNASEWDWDLLDEGTLHFQKGQFVIGRNSIPLDKILDYALDWGDLILLRTLKKRYALRLPKDSRAVWSTFLDEFIQRDRNVF